MISTNAKIPPAFIRAIKETATRISPGYYYMYVRWATPPYILNVIIYTPRALL